MVRAWCTLAISTAIPVSESIEAASGYAVGKINWKLIRDNQAALGRLAEDTVQEAKGHGCGRLAEAILPSEFTRYQMIIFPASQLNAKALRPIVHTASIVES